MSRVESSRVELSVSHYFTRFPDGATQEHAQDHPKNLEGEKKRKKKRYILDLLQHVLHFPKTHLGRRSRGVKLILFSYTFMTVLL